MYYKKTYELDESDLLEAIKDYVEKKAGLDGIDPGTLITIAYGHPDIDDNVLVRDKYLDELSIAVHVIVEQEDVD